MGRSDVGIHAIGRMIVDRKQGSVGQLMSQWITEIAAIAEPVCPKNELVIDIPCPTVIAADARSDAHQIAAVAILQATGRLAIGASEQDSPKSAFSPACSRSACRRETA